LHLRGGEHDFGLSYSIRRAEPDARQQPPGIGAQGSDEDHFGPFRHSRVPQAGAAESLRVADVDPVRRPINAPPKTLRVDKGFQQHHAMTEGFFPIPRQTPLA